MNDDILRRVPVQAIEAEQAVLGSVIVYNELFDDIAGILTAEDFYRESHRQVWTAIEALVDAHRPIDAITLADVLRPNLEAIGGGDYIKELAAGIWLESMAADYARTVREKSLQRQIASAATEIASRAYDSPSPWCPEYTADLIASAQYDFEKIANQAERKPDPNKGVAIDTLLWQVKHQAAPGIPTGFDTLDRWFYGFRPGQVTILAARTSRGKTAFATQTAINAARLGFKTVYFTCEMTAAELWQRAISCEAQVNLLDVQRRPHRAGEDNPYHADEEERTVKAAQALKELPLEILYRPGLQPRMLRADLARLSREMDGINLVVIDYLGLMRPDHHERDRWRCMQEVVLAVNGIAGDLGLPILLLSQLNREAADESRPPSLATLRDTGTCEENSHAVLFLWQEKAKDADNAPLADPTQPEELKVIIAKQRNGIAGGCIPLWFYKRFTRFEVK